MHTLTQRGQWEMRVDYQRNDKTWSYLHYNQFSVGSASEEYPLTVGGFNGLGNNLLNHQSYLHNGMKFFTTDNIVQLTTTVDGGMITATPLTSIHNHLMLMTVYYSVR